MTRLSRAYFPDTKRSDSEPALYAFMFIRDVHTGIMPYRTGGKYPYTANLARKNQKISKEVAKFLSIDHHDGILIDETLRETIETLSHHLATFGEVYLEVVYEDDTNKVGISDKKLVFLPLGKVIKVFGNYVQIVPLRNWQRGERKFYLIPSERIWHITLPRSLGTPRQHRKMLKKLNLLSEPTPKFTYDDGDLGSSAKYDFMAHHHTKDIALESITSSWGSIRSLSQIKGTTEYYYIVNRLQATYSQALLREHIIHKINDLLTRLGVKNSLKVEGLKTPSGIRNAISKLERGEIGFSEAMDAIKE